MTSDGSEVGGEATTNIFKQWSQVSETWINGRTAEPGEMYNELNQAWNRLAECAPLSPLHPPDVCDVMNALMPSRFCVFCHFSTFMQ